MSDFAPEPWFIAGDLIVSSQRTICVLNTDYKSWPAHAHLIEAAPEMYAALESVKAWLMDPFDAKDADDANLHPAFRKALKLVLAALAKVEGKDGS